MAPIIDDQQLTRLFLRLRSAGLSLGIEELLAAQRLARRALDQPDKADAGLLRRLRLLWCKSVSQQLELDQQWQRLRAEQGREQRLDDDEPSAGPSAERQPDPAEPPAPTPRSTPEPAADPGPAPDADR